MYKGKKNDCKNNVTDSINFSSESDTDYFNLRDDKIEEYNILKAFVDAYYSLKTGSKDHENISQFYSQLCEKFTYIFEQEDAHELLMVIFNMFNNYAKKQTLYKPRLQYMKVLKSLV